MLLLIRRVHYLAMGTHAAFFHLALLPLTFYGTNGNPEGVLFEYTA